jgi:hypothetical protein
MRFSPVAVAVELLRMRSASVCFSVSAPVELAGRLRSGGEFLDLEALPNEDKRRRKIVPYRVAEEIQTLKLILYLERARQKRRVVLQAPRSASRRHATLSRRGQLTGND